VIDSLFALYARLKKNFPDSALEYLQQGISYSRENSNSESLAKGLNLLSTYLLNRGLADSALQTNELEFSLVANGSSSAKARVYLNYGKALDMKGRYDEGVGWLLMAADTFARVEDPMGMAQAYQSLGNIYVRLLDEEKALKYYEQFLEISRMHKFDELTAQALGNLGIIYKSRNDFENALQTYNESLELHESLGDRQNVAVNLMNIGVLYLDSDSLPQAEKYLVKAMQLSKEARDNLVEVLSIINLTLVEEKRERLPEAMRLLDTALVKAKEIDYTFALRHIYDFYSDFLAATGDYKKAFGYRKIYETLNDSLSRTDYLGRINEIEAKYENQKKLTEILTLSEENLKKDNVLAQKNLIIRILIASSLVLIFLSVLTYAIIRQRNKLEKQRALLQAVTETELNEQKRVSRDLHDSIGSLLATVINELSGEIPGNGHVQRISKAKELVTKAAGEVRNISHNMLPADLLKFGLVSSLKSMIDNVDHGSSFETEFILFDVDKIDMHQTREIYIYRIIQELIQNIIRHANASKMVVQLTRHENYLNIMVQDDGVGFDTRKLTNGSGLGNLRSRVEYLNGKLSFDSNPGKGTTVIIDTPLTS
jgi:signal transduction histidine kinase